jgi:hypothetical protein
MTQPTLELIRKYLPQGAKIKQVSGTHWSCVDSAKAQRILGFKPSHVWQDYLNAQLTPEFLHRHALLQALFAGLVIRACAWA